MIAMGNFRRTLDKLSTLRTTKLINLKNLVLYLILFAMELKICHLLILSNFVLLVYTWKCILLVRMTDVNHD